MTIMMLAQQLTIWVYQLPMIANDPSGATTLNESTPIPLEDALNSDEQLKILCKLNKINYACNRFITLLPNVNGRDIYRCNYCKK